MTKKMFAGVFALIVLFVSATAFNHSEKNTPSEVTFTTANEGEGSANIGLANLYDSLHLDARRLNRQAFDYAIKGFEKLKAAGKIKKDHLLTIVDFSQPSTSKRMYIIDVKNRKLLQQSLVSHGRNTGMLMANSFSNQPESNKSSLGFYVTSETYGGKHGLSLRLDGMEKNINDNARNRAIVVHGADYASESFCKSTGYLGRSQGCPALPNNVSAAIINTIRNGSCLFIYSADKGYSSTSKYIL